MPDQVVCPIPRGISYDDARDTFNKVRKEMPGLTPAAIRREAARRMNVDYDTFLKAWKKPTAKPIVPDPVPPVVTPKIPSPAPVIKKYKAPPQFVNHISSNLKSDAKDSYKLVNQDTGETIGWIQKAQVGYNEIGPTNYSTGRFIVERRGYIALDSKGALIKIDGQSYLNWVAKTQDEAMALVRNTMKIDTPKVPEVLKPKPTPPPPVVQPLSYDTARAQFKLVKKENPTWSDAQVRREAANRMNVDYDTYLKAWKKPKGYEEPKPNTPRNPAQPTVRQPEAPKSVRDPKRLWKRKEPRVLGNPNAAVKWTQEDFSSFKVWRSDDFSINTTFSNPPQYQLSMRGTGDVGLFRTLDEAKQAANTVMRDGLPDHMMVNPGYGRITGSTKNCPSCTTSWELRRRGYDVRAVLMNNGAYMDDINRALGVRFEDHIGGTGYTATMPPKLTAKQLLIELDGMPDGARGYISVYWKNGGAHIYNWEVLDGKLWFVDAQSRKRWLADDDTTLRRGIDGSFQAARLDTIPDHEGMGWLTTDGVKQTKVVKPGWAR